MTSAGLPPQPRYDTVSPAAMGMPRNQWWVAAGAAEVGRTPLARKLLGESIVLYRTAVGAPVALEDRCPHRALPLAQGKVVGDNIQCGYHGMQFAPSGRCSLIPSQSTISPAMRVRSYPVVERGFWIWIWMGEATAADETLIPSPGYERTEYHDAFYLCLPMNANYQLLHENLLDTSHVSFVHPSLDAESTVAASDARFHSEGRLVRITRDIPDFRVSEAQAGALKMPVGAAVHKTMIAETYAPCLNVTINRYSEIGNPDNILFEQIAYLPVVPATMSSSYHFAALSSSVPRDKEQMTRILTAILQQDVVVLEGIQARADEIGPDGTEVSVRADLAGVKCRQIIAAMVRAEVAVQQ